MVYCLMLSDTLRLTQEAREFLNRTATRMKEEGRTELYVKGERLEAVVRTSFQHAFIGAISGTVFEARLETRYGQGTVRFIFTGNISPTH